jgi:hypothetical protein
VRVDVNVRVEPNHRGNLDAAIAARSGNARETARGKRVVTTDDEWDSPFEDRLSNLCAKYFADFNHTKRSGFGRLSAWVVCGNDVAEVVDAVVVSEPSLTHGRWASRSAGTAAAVIRRHAQHVDLVFGH